MPRHWIVRRRIILSRPTILDESEAANLITASRRLYGYLAGPYCMYRSESQWGIRASMVG